MQLYLAAALAWLLSLGAVGGLAYHYGVKNTTNADIAATAKAKAANDAAQAGLREQLATQEHDALLHHEAMDRQLAEERANVRVVTRTIHDEVPVYVTANAARMCALTDGFVQLHDDAASGKPSLGSPAGADDNGPLLVDRPSGITPAEAAEVIADNYGSCRDWQGLVKGLRARVSELETFYDNLRSKVHVCQ